MSGQNANITNISLPPKKPKILYLIFRILSIIIIYDIDTLFISIAIYYVVFFLIIHTSRILDNLLRRDGLWKSTLAFREKQVEMQTVS